MIYKREPNEVKGANKVENSDDLIFRITLWIRAVSPTQAAVTALQPSILNILQH